MATTAEEGGSTAEEEEGIVDMVGRFIYQKICYYKTDRRWNRIVN